MKKEIKRQIKAANRLIVTNDWGGDAYLIYGWVTRPLSREIWKLSDKRKVRAAAKVAVKAFARNSDGSFRRCGKVRAAARNSLAEVIFRLADKALVEMLENERRNEDKNS